MSVNAALKKKVATSLEKSISGYSKLPPITSPTDRKILSPTPVAVSFDGPTARISSNSKTTNEKSKFDRQKSPITNQNAANKKNVQTEIVKRHTIHSEVPGSDSSNGIKLVGFKLKSESESESDGKQNKWTPIGSTLPPCKVCGDDASGLHYGVNTCEACKAFFRRTLKRKNLDFQCTCTQEERALGTDAPRKTTCPKCRYERCVKLGMSKDAIKIGRYTIGRKRQNDREVKQLEEDKGRHNSDSSKSSDSPKSPGMWFSSPEEVTTIIDQMSVGEQKASAPAATGTAKKMRKTVVDDPETGLLFRSLTNSIFQILVETQSTNDSANLSEQKDGSSVQGNTEYSPMEQLLMQPFDPSLGKMSVEKPITTDGSHLQFQFSLQQQNGPVSVQQQNGLVSAPQQNGPLQQQNGPIQLNPQINAAPVYGTEPPKGGYSNDISYSPKGGNFDKHPIASMESNPNSPYGSKGGYSPYNSPGDVFQASPHGSTFSEQTSSEPSPYDQSSMEPSPIETLLMSPAYIPLPENVDLFDQETVLSGKLKAFDEQQVPNGDHHLGDEFNNIELLKEGDFGQVNNPEISTMYFEQENAKFQQNMFTSHRATEIINDTDLDDTDIFNDADLDQAESDMTITDLDLQLHEFNRFQCPCVKAKYNMNQCEIDAIINTLTGLAITLQSKFEIMTCDEIKQRHKAYLEQYKMKQQMFGTSTISQEEYMSFYNETGIDIDNRQQMVIEALKYMEDSISKLVNFAIGIPGFSDFDMDDQILLVKASRFEHDMIKLGGLKCVFSEDMNVVTTPWDKEYHVEELQRLLPTSMCQEKVRMSERVKALNLSLQEGVIVRAMIITSPDHVKLKDPVKVEAVHKKLIVCLLHLLENRRPDHPLTVQHLLEVIFELREVAKLDTKMMLEMFEIWPVSKNHQFVKEFIQVEPTQD